MVRGCNVIFYHRYVRLPKNIKYILNVIYVIYAFWAIIRYLPYLLNKNISMYDNIVHTHNKNS